MSAPSVFSLEDRLQEFSQHERVKQLTARIIAAQEERPLHSLAVLSVFPLEGKTLFCAAIAISFAEMQKVDVLIVDTTTVQNSGSLLLNACFTGSRPATRVRVRKETELSSVRAATMDQRFGLVFFDTAPLVARERSKVNPVQLARLCHASVLIGSRKLQTTPDHEQSLELLEDPTLHLLGMISNEAYTQ